MFYGHKRHGITMIEVIVVAVIIGILASMAALSATGMQNVARTNTARTDVEVIVQALRQYYLDHGQYPAAASWKTDLTSPSPITGLPYIQEVPKDPFGTGTDDYVYSVNGARTSGSIRSRGPDKTPNTLDDIVKTF